MKTQNSLLSLGKKRPCLADFGACKGSGEDLPRSFGVFRVSDLRSKGFGLRG